MKKAIILFLIAMTVTVAYCLFDRKRSTPTLQGTYTDTGVVDIVHSLEKYTYLDIRDPGEKGKTLQIFIIGED